MILARVARLSLLVFVVGHGAVFAAEVAPASAQESIKAPAVSNTVPVATQTAPTIPLPAVLRIGVVESPPFATKVGDHWEGLSIDLWTQVASRRGVKIEWTPITWKELPTLFAQGKIDVGPATVITGHAIHQYDFSVPFISSNLSLVTMQQSHGSWGAIFRQFRKSGVFAVLLSILALNFLIGLLLWLIERKSNSTQFGGNTSHGLGSAIWCAVTTMMTVGYGDKVPVTWAGRLVCFIVMLTGVVIISIFTAAAGSAMTVARLENQVSSTADLKNVTCVAINHSTGGDYLRNNNLRAIFVKSLDEAFGALTRGDAAVLVHDKIRVESRLKGEALGAVVLPLNLKEDYFAFTLQISSPLEATINAALEEVIDSDLWTRIQTNALGT